MGIELRELPKGLVRRGQPVRSDSQRSWVIRQPFDR